MINGNPTPSGLPFIMFVNKNYRIQGSFVSQTKRRILQIFINPNCETLQSSNRWNVSIAITRKSGPREKGHCRISVRIKICYPYAFPTLPHTSILLITYSFTLSLPQALYFFGSMVSGLAERTSFTPLENAIRRSVA